MGGVKNETAFPYIGGVKIESAKTQDAQCPSGKLQEDGCSGGPAEGQEDKGGGMGFKEK